MSYPAADYVIRIFNLQSSATNWEFEASSGQWGLRDESYGYLIPYRLVDGIATSGAPLDETAFFADCIAFDHDVPTLTTPASGHVKAPGTQIGMHRPWIDRDRQYEEALGSFFENLVDLRFTDSLRLRYGATGDPLAQFHARFPGGRRQLLALYVMALRQTDTLGAYLCTYRVLECADGRNGKTFIENHLNEIAKYNFGELKTKGMALPGQPVSDFEVFETYRSLALNRLNHLRTSMRDADIAENLYKHRNGLAHGSPGRSNIAIQDYATQAATVEADFPLLKLLARIAVETA
ncbi:methylamine utilization protein MauJ [Kitasatospora sp. NPDC006786]|uniref:methylamine utilization protein MauJ n=1 Tax=unclassified Kitasatospora TaxID=2633591 RepID=UPI0033C0F8FE